MQMYYFTCNSKLEAVRARQLISGIEAPVEFFAQRIQEIGAAQADQVHIEVFSPDSQGYSRVNGHGA
jgi:hypothetical protein